MTKIQVRRGPASGAGSWTLNDSVLASGEFGLDTTNGVLKIGDGTKTWSALGYLKSGTITFSSNFTVASYDGTSNISLDLNSSNTIVANKAKTLETPRKINGTDFDGSAAIVAGSVIYGRTVGVNGQFRKLYASPLASGAPTSPVVGDIWVSW